MAAISTFDPLAPNATPSSSKHTFRTLERERLNRHPTTTGPDHPALDELVKPHIESFNALIEDSTGTGKGLLQLAVEDIGKRVVFDGKREDGTYGNKLSCECCRWKRPLEVSSTDFRNHNYSRDQSCLSWYAHDS